MLIIFLIAGIQQISNLDNCVSLVQLSLAHNDVRTIYFMLSVFKVNSTSDHSNHGLRVPWVIEETRPIF